MTEVKAAIQRGEDAAVGRASQYQPEGVEYRGTLIARVREKGRDAVEGIYQFRGSWLYYGVGLKGDEYRVYPVRDRGLRKVVDAMIGSGADDRRDALIRETSLIAREATRKKVAKMAKDRGTPRRRRKR